VNNAEQMVRYVEARVRQAIGDERGDVPGWVMITIMTCAIAAIIWGLAGPWLRGLFDTAAKKVTDCQSANPGGAVGGAPANCP
jgi:hypothetical protein